MTGIAPLKHTASYLKESSERWSLKGKRVWQIGVLDAGDQLLEMAERNNIIHRYSEYPLTRN